MENKMRERERERERERDASSPDLAVALFRAFICSHITCWPEDRRPSSFRWRAHHSGPSLVRRNGCPDVSAIRSR